MPSLLYEGQQDDNDEVVQEVHHDGGGDALSPDIDEGEYKPHHAHCQNPGRPFVAVAE